MTETIQPGTLYVVSTPIGNLGDISHRALHILGTVDVIAAEDTRTSRVLLEHYGIATPLVSYFIQNELRRIPELVQRLKAGGSVAVVSDAGTPGISDPAFALVRAALQDGAQVVSIPGASAMLAALVASGLPTERFVFEGFLPHKKGRKTRVGQIAGEPRTVVLYESPHRIERTLGDLAEAMGDRRAVLARELTKKFEEMRRGTVRELLEGVRSVPPRGEIVLVIEGCDRRQAGAQADGGEEKESDHG
ncbi:MAG: 16S rRNA (cytidine(1402)-2'-O)-methyltransferase [Ignavibacteriae bacterium]|nr:16S rRNA (cytidine(1402)-2'-O)-methyltransferase [Ignavibacteriota bacterium]